MHTTIPRVKAAFWTTGTTELGLVGHERTGTPRCTNTGRLQEFYSRMGRAIRFRDEVKLV